ncbi:hypothetical protein CTAYLR_002777 [Chrysophaeum taylorii]|uniref:UBX domain-containing protein n=1 Tax=Chrysophaeum taylorii TaxID=2483200 RepID=A0AAD7UBQ3_9STRA|nr:hypothetical protein CTAYLR_002777 [Chrysophaeum taylorii]
MARKKRCELGASCPYQHEGQHQAEYYHTASPARREGRRGRRLGGAGATTTARRGATTAARRGSSRQTPQRTPRATSRRSPIVIDDSPDRTASLDDDDVELISPPPRARSVPEAPKGRSYEEDLAKALALSKADNDRAIARAQDAEFEASLAEDRRKASKRDRDDLERREQAELERALAASKEEDDRARDTRKRAKKAEFQTVQEPTDDVVRVRLRLPDGRALERRFDRSTASLADLRDFVEAMASTAPKNFALVDAASRNRITGDGSLATLASGASIALLVVDVDA